MRAINLPWRGLILGAALCGGCASSDAGTDAPSPVGSAAHVTGVARGTSTRSTDIAWVYHDGRFYWPGDYSFAAKPDYSDRTGAAPSGKADIKVTLTAQWGGFLPFAPHWDFDASGYGYLIFSLKPTVAHQSIQVFFEKVGDVPVGKVVDPFKYGPMPRVGEWGRYRIPLADLGVAGIHIYKFAIQDETGLTENSFYLDDIGFAPPGP